MTTKTFDPTKPVQLRRGNPARIVATDAKGRFPILALYEDEGSECPILRHANGTCSYKDNPYDLINVPETVELFFNLYDTLISHGRKSRQDADLRATPIRIGVARLSYVLGDKSSVKVEVLDN